MNPELAAIIRRWTHERYGVAAMDWEIQDLIERIAEWWTETHPAPTIPIGPIVGGRF